VILVKSNGQTKNKSTDFVGRPINIVYIV
jgi:hypothetical protein